MLPRQLGLVVMPPNPLSTFWFPILVFRTSCLNEGSYSRMVNIKGRHMVDSEHMVRRCAPTRLLLPTLQVDGLFVFTRLVNVFSSKR